MRILPANDASVKHAAELLRTGGVVAFPTETVYGLGALALEPASVARIFEIKRRPRFDPLIVHVLNRAMLDEVVANVPPLADELARRFWPGPLTLVLPKRGSVPALVTSGLPTVAVRMPSHRIARSLLQAVGGPIAAPSANRFGSLSPTRAEHVDESLNDDVDLILDGGSTEFGIESTIVAFDPEPSVLRPGALEIEALEAIVGPIAVISEGPARAPGMLRRHYAPRTPLRLIDPATVPVSERVGAGVLSLRDRFDGYAEMRVLSPSGDLREAAAAFFEALHELDSAKLGRIDAQPIDDGGLGLAMMDRLRRAAASRNV